MKRLYIFLFIMGLLGAACSNDDLTDSIIKDSDVKLNATDIWIKDHFTSTYNIEVIYRWTDEETDFSKNLVPPELDSVVPYLKVVEELWIDTYIQEAGEDFVKSLAPKQILLVGSLSYNSDGTVTEGTAEGGRKMVLYGVNSFDRKDKNDVLHMIHIIHHEFAHIMHQMKDYGVEFKQVTPSGYTSTWYNISDKQARESGFITPYAHLNTDEDFVEMVATMLTNTREEWEAILSGIAVPSGVEALKKKEVIVANYFMEKWGIDIYSFRDLLSQKIAEIISEE